MGIKESSSNASAPLPEPVGKQLPKKWNAIVGNGVDVAEPLLSAHPPESQPNQKDRSESVPCVNGARSLVEEGMPCLPPVNEMDEAKNKTGNEDLSSNLYRAIWRTLDGNIATSPIRSPVVADWKVVGSPSGSIQKITDPIDQLLDDEAKLREGSGSLSGFSSVDRTRRMRSASVIGELLQNAGSDLFQSTASSPVNSEQNGERRGGGSSESYDDQVAQLPTMLHEDLGLENDAEATEIFQRSSMESILDDLVEGSASAGAVGTSSDYFKNMTFGPLSSLGFASKPSNIAGSPILGEDPSVTGTEKRRPSYLGLTDWPLSAGAIGTGRPEYFAEEELNVDDYFGNSNMYQCDSFGELFANPYFNSGSWNIPVGQRLSRRHSLITAPENALEEQFRHFGFGSVPKASPPKHSHNHGIYGYAGHGSMGPAGYYDGVDFDGGLPARDEPPPFQLSSYVGPLWAVEFKSGRTEIFYVLENDGAPQVQCTVGDLVIVEADRGEDLGRITAEISVAKMRSCISGSDDGVGTEKNAISSELASLLRSKEIIPKRIHRLAQNGDLKLLQAKAQEEALAMVRCQSRIRQKKLPMDVVDAEYQWDRNKLTFYFIADRRIDFRELVRDLFRIYKTRIWMCAVDKTSPRMINYLGGLVPVHADDAPADK